MLLNCGVGEDSWESLGLQGDPTSPLKEISPEYSLEGLMLKLKLQYFGHLMRRTDSWKYPDAAKDWGQEEKGMTEDEMVGWHHQLDGHEFEWTPGVGDGQRGLACCSPWGHKQSEMAERLNWTELNQFDWPLERVLDKQKWVLYPCPGMVTSKLCGHFLLILCWFLCILNSLAMQ